MNLSRIGGQSGVTLVELVIAMAILAILATLALPSFQTMIENQRLRAAAESMLNGLQLARAEAIRRNARVRFVIEATGPGWKVELEDATAIQVRPAGEAGADVTVVHDGDTAVTYNAFGRRVAGAGTLSQITVGFAGNARPLQIQIGADGLVRMCEDSTYLNAGDPRRCDA